jgi:protein TonB
MSKLPKTASDRRVGAAALSAVVHLALLAGLLLWHFTPGPHETGPSITVIDVPVEPRQESAPPTPPPEAGQPTSDEAEAREAARPVPAASPAPLADAIPITVPSFAPAPRPATGVAPTSGAALAGTGTGAGGAGSGTGGDGDGDGQVRARPVRGTPPEIIRGGFRRSDYPRELRALGPEGTTWADVVVGTNGRVTSCRITRPSGIPQFDAKTCQILLQRFRYRPARDPSGRPIPAADSFSVDWDYVALDED